MARLKQQDRAAISNRGFQLSTQSPAEHPIYPEAHSTPISGNLSSTLAGIFSEISGGGSDSLHDMSLPTLQSYVNKAFEETEGLSEVKASKRAERLGHKISPGYISDIRSGKAKNPSVKKLRALAAAIGRTEDDVLSIARGKPLTVSHEYQESMFAAMWAEYSHLSAAQKREVKQLVEMLQREIQRRLTH